MPSKTPSPRRAKKRKRGCLRAAVLALVMGVAALYGMLVLSLMSLKWINPWTTAVQTERRVDALLHHRRYHKLYRFVGLRQISPDLQHAVLASEDERFHSHSGIDWIELKKVMEENLAKGKFDRGGSTITQQLVRNLFLSTQRSGLRKILEFTIVPLAEVILGKDRILELYLNVIEWGPGIFGAEAASRFYYKQPAARVNREESARLAACLPAPLKRQPATVGGYAAVIEIRMRQMGW